MLTPPISTRTYTLFPNTTLCRSIMFHAVYADGLSLMFALVANVEHGFIAADLDVLHRQLPTLILPAEILQHVPAFLDWSSGRVLHFEAPRSDRLERGHEVIDPAFAEHVGLGPQKCRQRLCAWYGHCPSARKGVVEGKDGS